MAESQQFHESFQRDEQVKGSSNRTFGLVFFVVFTLITIWPVLFSHSLRWWTAPIALGFLVVSFVAPQILAPLNKAWTRLGMLMHRVVNPLIMGLLFYVAITPMGLLMRLFGKDLLRLKRDPQASSYWIERNPPGPSAESMRRQF